MATINLDDLMEKAKELADAAGKKTGELYELSKYKYECIRLSNELKKLYEKLGSTVYKQVKTGGSDNEEIDIITAEIDDRRLRIAEIKDIMAEMTNKKSAKAAAQPIRRTAYSARSAAQSLKRRSPLAAAAMKKAAIAATPPVIARRRKKRKNNPLDILQTAYYTVIYK